LSSNGPGAHAERTLRICECWARDGIQSWGLIQTADKLRVLDAAIDAGIREIDATSFVPVRVVPQFFDNLSVLQHLADRGLYVRVLAPNLRGFQDAIRAQGEIGAISAIGFPISASEAHNLANVRLTHDQHFEQIEQMTSLARESGMTVMAAVATAFGCPIIGTVDEDQVFAVADRLVGLGVTRLMLSDTTGLADPIRVRKYVSHAKEAFPEVEFIAHFHDTRGTGLLNTWAAIEGGIDVIDSSLGGLGGEPRAVEQNHSGETGNIATEDLVVALQRAGFTTNIDVDRIIEAGRLQEKVTGVAARAQVLRTGPGL
jgi:hydroxymethylglutaryl-CoA lyase